MAASHTSKRGRKQHFVQVVKGWVATQQMTQAEGDQAIAMLGRARTREEQQQVMDALRHATGGFRAEATDFAARLLDEDLFADD